MEPIRVVIADDHKLVRSGFKAMLRELHVDVVAETGDGHEALNLLAQHRPDIALLDITMPGLTGIEVANRIKKSHPQIKIIILSMHTTADYIAQAIRAGVSGYLLKNADPVELELAIRAASDGHTYLSPAVSKCLVEDYARRVGPGGGVADQLTDRQREILQLLAEGKSNKDVARILKVSVKTVETHRKQLMDRLGIHDIAGLVRFAIRVGIIRAED